MDHIVWAALIVFKHCLHAHEMRFVLRSGEELVGPVHEDWIGNCEMSATALDLKSAYKQLPLHQSDANKTVVTIAGPCRLTGETLFDAYSAVWVFGLCLTFQSNQLALVGSGMQIGIVVVVLLRRLSYSLPVWLGAVIAGSSKAMMNLLGFQLRKTS